MSTNNTLIKIHFSIHVNNGKLKGVYYSLELQVTDAVTKLTKIYRFEKLRALLRIVSLNDELRKEF